MAYLKTQETFPSQTYNGYIYHELPVLCRIVANNEHSSNPYESS